MRPSRSTGKALVIAALLLTSLASWLALPGYTKVRAPRIPDDERSEPSTSLAKADGPTRARWSEAYGKLPLSFEANQGQFDSRVKFVARSSGHILYLTSTEAVLAFNQIEPLNKQESPLTNNVPRLRNTCLTSGTVESGSARLRQTVLRMSLKGANTEPETQGIGQLPGKSNYFIGNDPSRWRTDVPQFAKVKYREVYAGVDLICYGNKRQLEYDFVLAPEADPRAINLAFEGAEEMHVDGRGDLVITTGAGEVRQHKPVAYQEVNGIKKDIGAVYVMRGRGEVRFEVAPYDPSRPLVIDPIVAYSTYLGGSSEDRGLGIAVDSTGNAYVTGDTQSTNFPTTPGAFRTVHGFFSEVFVTKLNSSGTSLIYSTYLGFGEGNGIAVDSTGSAYVVGTTGSDSFPTTPGAFDRTYNGGGDAFVTKLNSTGAALIYSTFLGGTGIENGRAIAVDLGGNACVTGLTTSSTFPITPGAFQSEFRGGRGRSCEWGDAFVTKLRPTGTDLIYSTFLGGKLSDGGDGIAVDSTGNAYVTGATESDNFPASPDTFQPIHTPCHQMPCASCVCEDAFVTKLNATGTSMVYSTFLGGFICDIGTGIAIDSLGDAYVTGYTNSPDFPTANPIQAGFGGYRDAFVTKINATGSSLIYSTFLGGADDDEAFGVAADSARNAYVIGQTVNSVSFAGDSFVAKFNPSGSLLVYFTSLGGSGFESSYDGGIAVDSYSRVYVTGSTSSTDFPTTPGAFQTTFGGGSNDAFVARIDDIPPFDLCLQDETTGATLQVNSTTGDYRFVSCSGLSLAGTSAITRRGCLITLQVNGPGLRLLARIDTCMNSGTASIQVFSQGSTITILDRNTANNTCACPR